MRPAEMLLLAAGLDWLEGLLPFLFVLIWIVSQVMNLFRNAAGKQGERPGGQPVRPPRPAARPHRPPAEQQGGDIDREIQEFLTRSLRGEQSPPPPRPPVRSRPPKPIRSKPTGTSRLSRSESSRDTAIASRIGGLAGRGGDVADHVAAAFAHDLAHEVPVTAGADGSSRGSGLVEELVAAVRSPDELRKLILLREVLDRPTHRW